MNKELSLKTPRIFWLASYPKSGNTWFRSFLQALLDKEQEQVEINQLVTGEIASSRHWIDSTLGFDSADLTHDEVDDLRASVYQWSSEQAQEYEYHKIHDAYINDSQGKPLFGDKGVAGGLYIVRNPLDVCISLANHERVTIDEAIKRMGRAHAYAKSPKKLTHQLRQKMGTWSDHVSSWLSTKDIPIKVIRYEDMHRQALQTFSGAAEFLQLDNDPKRIRQALDACQFEKLQSQEKGARFKEAPPNVEHFFRKGEVGDWKSTLTEHQVKMIIQDHRVVMRELKYLDDQDNPIV